MTALIGLVQRPRRKQHLAVLTDNNTVWATLGSCRLVIPFDGTLYTPIANAASIGTAAAQDDGVCLHCLHLIAFARVLESAAFTTRHVEAAA